MASLSVPFLRPQTFPPLDSRRPRTKTHYPFLFSEQYPTRILAFKDRNSIRPVVPDRASSLKPLTETTWKKKKKKSRNKKKLVENLPVPGKGKDNSRANGGDHVGGQEKMWLLCGTGYWVQGFRCFPWLALNYHIAYGLGLSPSTLQLVQQTGNLPMVAKPLYGLLSDALYIGGAHRLPYISFGAFLQAVSWGTLAIIPLTLETFSTQMICILLGNLGASFTEVVTDALVVEFGKAQKAGVLQSYACMALAAGSILGNLSGGFFLLRCQEPKLMFFTFSFLLMLQLALSLSTSEGALYPIRHSNHQFSWSSVVGKLYHQFSNMVRAISEERIALPLSWMVASIATIPLLSGTMFCFQTQCLNLNPSIIGLSKVIGQIFFLLATFVYNRYLRKTSLRRLIFCVQALYALCILSDLLLVKQMNLKLGISNEIHVLCLSTLAEAAAQFKILPFAVLLAGLCPPGCEGSLFAFFASAISLASIVSGILGIGLASIIGLSSGDYSALPLGILLQSLAALVPLGWISSVPDVSQASDQGRMVKRSWTRMKGSVKWSLS